MPAYPGTEREQRVGTGDLNRLVTAIFSACGMSDEDAALVAGSLVSADLRGVHSHGVFRVPGYVARLTGGAIDPRGRPRVARDEGATLVVDGGNAMGQVAVTFAMRAAIERARTTNVSVAAVGGSNHCGAMAHYVRIAIAEGMIGIATTNALPIMAPWGGLDSIVGINPLAIGIPTAGEPPFVIDTSFAGAANGKIRVYQQKGLPIPEGWAFDAQGRPTTDPAQAVLMHPIGGYKGVGLAVAMGLLATVLSGAAYGSELGTAETGAASGRDGQFVIALRPGAFQDPDLVTGRVDRVIRELRSSRPAEGVARIYSPGEVEAETEAQYGADGIPLNDETLEGLRTSATRLGVEASLVRAISPPGP